MILKPNNWETFSRVGLQRIVFNLLLLSNFYSGKNFPWKNHPHIFSTQATDLPKFHNYEKTCQNWPTTKKIVMIKVCNVKANREFLQEKLHRKIFFLKVKEIAVCFVVQALNIRKIRVLTLLSTLIKLCVVSFVTRLKWKPAWKKCLAYLQILSNHCFYGCDWQLIRGFFCSRNFYICKNFLFYNLFYILLSTFQMQIWGDFAKSFLLMTCYMKLFVRTQMILIKFAQFKLKSKFFISLSGRKVVTIKLWQKLNQLSKK